MGKFLIEIDEHAPAAGRQAAEIAFTQHRIRALFEKQGESRQVRRGDRLHHAGDEPRYAYLVTGGWLARMRSNAAGDPAFTGVHIAGDMVGADAVLNGRLDDDITALTHGSVLRARVNVVLARMSEDVGTAIAMARLLATDGRFLREALLAVGRQTSSERLSAFVLQTHHRLVAAKLIPEHATCFDLPLTQAQLAAVTGLTGVHVNRVLKLLRDSGCLEIRSGVVHINDMTALQREARSGRLAHGHRESRMIAA